VTRRRIHAAIFLLVGIGLIFAPLPSPVKDLLYRTYNLVLFAYIVWALAGPRAREFFATRRARIEAEIREAREIKERAQQLLETYRDKVASLEREKEEILERYQKEGEAERTRIVREAEVEARRIVERAREIIGRETRRAREGLKEEAARASVVLARELISAHLTKEDQKRALEETVERIKDLRS
jgi:F-type H+-transporting ATPase subunit b